MKRLLLSLAFGLLLIQNSYSTHLTGGTLTYEYLGGSSYRIMLRMYRAADLCAPHVACAGTVPIDVYTASGTWLRTLTVPLIQTQPVTPYIDSCAAYPPCVALDQCTYTIVVNNMPPIPGGYFLYHEICCRNSAILNINSPLGSGPCQGGMGFPCYIPDMTILLTNTSPTWKNPPPVFVCQGFDVEFDHSASDVDGDSLVYSYYTPFSDINYTTPADLTFTAGVPNLVNVCWLAGFSATNPLGGAGLTIGSDGIIHGIPPSLGQYVAGVRCDEYRDGVMIGSVYRDFQFNVVNCPPPTNPVIGESTSCDGDYTVTFSNLSAYDPLTTTFLWDFDIATPGADTSNLANPTYTYPAIYQCYDVMLITQPYTKCADTAYKTICVDQAIADFNSVDSICINSAVTFTDLSSGSPSNPVTGWNWNFGDATTSTSQNPVHFFSTAGLLNVQLAITTQVGCKDTIIKPLFVQGLPSANAGPDLNSCLNNPTVTLTGAVTNSTGGIWVNGLGTFNPNDPTLMTVDYTPDTSEISMGTLWLVLTTTGNGMCPSAFDSVQINFVPGPTANAGADISVCRDTNFVQLNGTFTVAGGVSWGTSGSGSFSSTTNPNAIYTPAPADTVAGCIMLFLSTTLNANCNPVTDTMLLCFYAPPVISVMANDTICTGQPLVLNATSSTGAGYWSTVGTGDGTFSPDSLVTATSTPTYVPGTNDAVVGTVTFVFTSTNNGGCKMQDDTLLVSVIPSPAISFVSDQVCFGNATNFTNTSTAIGGISSYNWIYSGSTISTAPSPSYLFPTEGNQAVSLVVTSNNGCIDTLTQNVIVNYLPNPGFNNPTLCLQGGTPFSDASTVTGSSIVSWDWTFGDGLSDTAQNPTHQYPASGNYNVELIVTSAQGCSDSITQTISVLPAPIADFNVSPYFANPFQTINFTDSSTPVVSWYWDFGDTTGTSTLQNPSYAYNGSFTYNVMLVVTDSNGCKDTTRKEVIIFLPPQVPSGFSPNGSGSNDFLFVYGGPFIDLNFKVYNSWGQIIFETTTQSEGWDGTFRTTGVPQPIGVYVWTLKCITPDGQLYEKAGDVTLLR